MDRPEEHAGVFVLRQRMGRLSPLNLLQTTSWQGLGVDHAPLIPLVPEPRIVVLLENFETCMTASMEKQWNKNLGATIEQKTVLREFSGVFELMDRFIAGR